MDYREMGKTSLDVHEFPPARLPVAWPRIKIPQAEVMGKLMSGCFMNLAPATPLIQVVPVIRH